MYLSIYSPVYLNDAVELFCSFRRWLTIPAGLRPRESGKPTLLIDLADERMAAFLPSCRGSAKHPGARTVSNAQVLDEAVRNPATTKTEVCIEHGDGAWCQTNGCSKDAQRDPSTLNTEFWKAHGSGAVPNAGCLKSVKHDPATKKAEFCVGHGDGKRCQMQ